MFGLSIEKLIIVAIVAGLILGPHRLPLYAEKLAGLVRTVRDVLDVTRARAESEIGAPLDAEAWVSRARELDPRRIVRNAFAADGGGAGGLAGGAGGSAPGSGSPGTGGASGAAGGGAGGESSEAVAAGPAGAAGPMGAAAGADPSETAIVEGAPGLGDPAPSAGRAEGADPRPSAEDGLGDAEAAPPARRERWVVVGGSSGHPRRVRVVDGAPRPGAPDPDPAREAVHTGVA